MTQGWRCFHCDEVFTDRSAAAAHFGASEDSQPACRIKAGAEGSLVRALREAEEAAANAMFAVHEETTDAARAYQAQMGRHRRQIEAAEELGYERGLRDGSKLDEANTALRSSAETIASLTLFIQELEASREADLDKAEWMMRDRCAYEVERWLAITLRHLPTTREATRMDDPPAIARDGIEAQHGLNDTYPGDPYP